MTVKKGDLVNSNLPNVIEGTKTKRVYTPAIPLVVKMYPKVRLRVPSISNRLCLTMEYPINIGKARKKGR